MVHELKYIHTNKTHAHQHFAGDCDIGCLLSYSLKVIANVFSWILLEFKEDDVVARDGREFVDEGGLKEMELGFYGVLQDMEPCLARFFQI